MAKITLIGLEQFLNPDHSVFDNIDLPEGIDKDTLINSILLRCGEFELLYPDPEFMTMAVTLWGKKNYWTFSKWVELINKEYDPLYNKDYYEDLKINHEGSDENTGKNHEGSDYTRTDNLRAESDINEVHSEKAYNDSDFVSTTRDVTDGESRNTGTQKNAGTTDSNFESKAKDKFEDVHALHAYGNIGITSAQELFLKQAEVARFNLYEQISDLFCQEFCIMIF